VSLKKTKSKGPNRILKTDLVDFESSSIKKIHIRFQFYMRDADAVLWVFMFLAFCVVFLFCLSSSYCVLCAQCCRSFWIVHSWLHLRFSQTFIVRTCTLKPYRSILRHTCITEIYKVFALYYLLVMVPTTHIVFQHVHWWWITDVLYMGGCQVLFGFQSFPELSLFIPYPQIWLIYGFITLEQHDGSQ